MNVHPRRKSSRYSSILFLPLLFISLALLFIGDAAHAQEIPCANARSGQRSFLNIRAKDKPGDCRAGRMIRRVRAESGTDVVMISGHVTHQNGVRMAGVTMTLRDLNANTSRTVVTDTQGNYVLANIPWGSRVELTPSLGGYAFFPPSVIWEGIVDDEVWNFIAAGPPPAPPPPPGNQPTLAWSSYFDNAQHLADYNAMMGRDALGNVYVGGTSYTDPDSAGNTDIVLFKTDPNGNRVWSRTFNGQGQYKDALRDMFVDAAGNTYLAGYSYVTDTTNPAFNGYDYVVLKYNAAGDLVWTKYYGGNQGYDDFARSLKVDPAGNVYVAGYSWGVGTYANYATVKYDANGNQLWAKRFAGGNGEILNEVEIDAGGNVYVTGYSNNSSAGGSEDIVTIKYNAAGDQIWLNRYASAAGDSDEGYELEVNAAGDVIVIGETYDFSISKTIFHKINGSDGSTAWTRDLNATNGQFGEYPSSMELDASGNILITGMLYEEVSYNVDAFVAKLNGDAMLQWVRSYDGPNDEDYDGDPKMTFDSTGNIYLALTSEGFANADIQVIKYTSAGVQDWTYRFGNPFFGFDGVMDYQADLAQTTMMLDPQGNVYLTGESDIPDQSADLVVFKLEPIAQTRAVPFDFDFDRKADIAVFRPETGVWWVLNSSDGSYSAVGWGLSTDKIVPGDYDGDGRFDRAVYRDGIWYVLKSSDWNWSVSQFGLAGDIPIPTDFDNDGKADLNVFRQGIWHSLRSSNNAYEAMQFGISGDRPVPSDYDSNRRSDMAVYRNGVWFVSYQFGLPLSSGQFGVAADKLVPADYDGDRKTDLAVFRQGVWYVWESSTASPRVFQWGMMGDIPVPADYDGDRKTDFAVYRQGTWYIYRSSDSQYAILQFGLPTDIPVASAYVQ